MSRMKASAVLFATLATSSFLHVTPAAAAMTYQQRASTLTTSGLSCGDFSCPIGTTTTTVTDFSTFSDSMSYNGGEAIATQQSSLGTNEIQVNSTTSAVSAFLGSASSNFSVQFSLNDTENFNFTGTGISTYSGATVKIELTGPNGLDYSAPPLVNSNDNNQYSVSASGTLGPGTYNLVVDALSGGDNNPFANAQATLEVAPVPLPAAGLLLLSGLAPLGFFGRMHRRLHPSA